MSDVIELLSLHILAKMKDNHWRSALATFGEADGVCNFVVRDDGQVFIGDGSYCSQQGYSSLNKLDASELGRAFDNLEPCIGHVPGADAAWLAGGPAPITAAIKTPPLIDREENLAKTRAKVVAEGRNGVSLPEMQVRIPTSKGVAKISFKGGTSFWKTFWTFETIEDVVVQRGASLATIPAGAEVFGFMNGPVSESALPGSSYLIPLTSLVLAKEDLALLAGDILSKGINQGDELSWATLQEEARNVGAQFSSPRKLHPKR